MSVSQNKVPLSDILTLQRGFDLPAARRKPGNVPVVASTGIVGYHSESKVQAPGVVIGRSGSIGGGQFIAEDFWPLNTTLWVKDFNGHNRRFAYYLLRSIDFSRFNAGAGVPTLNRNHLKSLFVPRFDLAQEERIAFILSTYDDLIENSRRRIKLLEQAARLLYKEWFVHLRFPGHQHSVIVNGVPKGWKKRTALDMVAVLSGGTPKTKVSDYWGGEIPFFTPRDVTDSVYAYDTEKRLTEDGLRNCNSRLYPKDTVFITARGTVGKVNLAQSEMAMNQSCYALVAKPPLNQHYLYFALVEGVEQLRGRAVGAVFNAIIRDTFKLLPFVVPEDRLVQVFTSFASSILRQVDVLSTETLKLVKARDLLLPRLMSGELSA